MCRAVFCLSLIALPLLAQPVQFLSLDQYLTDWRVSKEFTIAVAQKMPADSYSFRATPEEMSFGEQMRHLAESLFVRFSQISGQAIPSPALGPDASKAAIVERIGQSFDYVARILPTLTDQKLSGIKFKVDFEGRPSPEIDGREMIRNMFVHVAHHRAQCEVYLRLKGIVPPTYTF